MADEFSTRLADAAYAGIRFPVETAETESGHDSAEHTAYRRRGADIEPTGLRAKRGTLVVPMVNTPALVARYGTLFPGLNRTLTALFEELPIGELTHPIHGVFQAHIKSWKETASSASRSGVALHIEWVEHNATALEDLGPDGSAPSDATTNTAALATVADEKMAAIPASGYTPVKPVIDAQLDALDLPDLAFAEVAACFRLMLAVIEFDLALASLATAAAHDARSALEDLRAAVLAMQARTQPGLSSVRRYTVPTTQALWQVAQAVYGDASKDGLLMAANAIPDALFVPAGTVLTVLPDTSV